MKFNDFEDLIRKDNVMSSFIRDIISSAQIPKVEENASRMLTVSGAEALYITAAYAFYRWIKDYLDNRRAKNEISTAKQQEQLIKKLIDDGFTPEESSRITISLLENISKRTKDDVVIKKAISLIES